MTDCSLAKILNEKMTPLRQEGANAFFRKQVNEEFYQKMIDKIQKTAPSFKDLNLNTLKKQLVLANQAYLQGAVKENIELDHPLLQYVWALALIRIASQPEIMQKWPTDHQSKNGLINSKIWEQIKKTDMMQTELQNVTVMLASRGFIYDTIKIRWGGANYPDVGYYFSPSEKLVNLDLLWGMFMGLEHARSVVFHELAHSCGTRKKTPQFIEYDNKCKALAEKQLKSSLTEEEKKEYQKLMLEKEFLFFVFDEAENSFANGFACLLTDENLYYQDLRYDVCSVETQCFLAEKLFTQTSDILTQKINNSVTDLDQNKKTPMSEFSNMKKVLRLAFFSNNGLFENKVSEWEKVGVHVDWLKGYDQNGKAIKGQEVLNEFCALSGALQSYQIPLDIHSSRASVIRRIEAANDARNAITDDIYNRFFKEIADQIYNELSKENELDNIQKEMQDRQSGSDNKSQSGAQLTYPNMNGSTNQSQNSEPQKQEDQTNQQNQQDKSGQGKGDQKDTQQDKSGQGKGDQKDTQQDKSGQGKGDQKDTQQDKSEQGKEEQKDTPADKKDDKNEDSNSVKERIDRKKINDSDQGESVKEIIYKSEQKRKADESEQIDNQNESSEKNELAELILSNRSDFKQPEFKKDKNMYNNILAKYPSELKKLKDLFSQLRNVYLDEKYEKQRELIPEGQLNDSLNIQSVQGLLVKTATGQKIGIDDFKHYNNPIAPKVKKAPIDICVFIDVSGSVECNGYSKLAVEIGCLLNEAVRKNDCFNVYVGLMTDPVCFLAEPGMDDKEIAGKLGAVYNGSNWSGSGDHIYNATTRTLQKIIDRKGKQEKEGAVHFFYITDGGHTDEEISRPTMNILMDHSIVTTFNWIRVPGWEGVSTCLNKLEHDRKNLKGPKGIINMRVGSSDEVLPAIKRVLKERIMDMKRFSASPVELKKRHLNSALKEVYKQVDER